MGRSFREAGARFVVPVGEHHDGFAMYDSSISRSAKQMGPHRDIIGDFAIAVRDRRLPPGRALVVFQRGDIIPLRRANTAFQDLYGPAMPDIHQPDKKCLEDWLTRCCDLIDNHKPQVLYFDWWMKQPHSNPTSNDSHLTTTPEQPNGTSLSRSCR